MIVNEDFLDFYSGLAIWADVFDERNVSVGIMGRNGCIGEGLIHDFLAKLDLEDHIDKFDYSGGISNKSPGFLNLEISRLNNKFNSRMKTNGSINRYWKKINDLINKSRVGSFGTFTSAYDEEIFNRFNDSNILLAKKYLGESRNPFDLMNSDS